MMNEQKNENNFDKLLKKQILAFELHKNQSYVDRLLKEGEIKGLLKLQSFYKSIIEAKYMQKQEKLKSFKSYEVSLKKYNIDTDGPKVAKELYKVYKYLENSISALRDELSILKATENIFSILDRDIEDSLTNLDILNNLKENKGKFSPDVQARVDAGLCGLKRPGGKKKFICDGKIIQGTKYCKEHLIKYDPVTYTDIFEQGE
jgi:hypothetical protein